MVCLYFSSLKLYKWLCYRSSVWKRRRKSFFRQLPVCERFRCRSIWNGGPCQRETARWTWGTLRDQGCKEATHCRVQEDHRSGHCWEGSVNTNIWTPIYHNSSLVFPKWGTSKFLKLFTYFICRLLLILKFTVSVEIKQFFFVPVVSCIDHLLLLWYWSCERNKCI